MPSELSRFLKSDDWQKKLVPGSLGGVGVAVTVSDDWFGSVGVCLYVSNFLVSIMIHLSCLSRRTIAFGRTHAKTPYPAASRVKKVLNCIFVSVGFVVSYKLGEVERLCDNVKIEGITLV